jgi:hypothetical protein
MWEILGLRWSDVLKVNDTAHVLYQSQTNIRPRRGRSVAGYPSGYV